MFFRGSPVFLFLKIIHPFGPDVTDAPDIFDYSKLKNWKHIKLFFSKDYMPFHGCRKNCSNPSEKIPNVSTINLLPRKKLTIQHSTLNRIFKNFIYLNVSIKKKHLFSMFFQYNEKWPSKKNCKIWHGRDFETKKKISSIKFRFSKTMNLLVCEFLFGKINYLDYQVGNFVWKYFIKLFRNIGCFKCKNFFKAHLI